MWVWNKGFGFVLAPPPPCAPKAGKVQSWARCNIKAAVQENALRPFPSKNKGGHVYAVLGVLAGVDAAGSDSSGPYPPLPQQIQKPQGGGGVFL